MKIEKIIAKYMAIYLLKSNAELIHMTLFVALCLADSVCQPTLKGGALATSKV